LLKVLGEFEMPLKPLGKVIVTFDYPDIFLQDFI
jgi:hypothetical protein